jgi:hypothetical protein
MNLCSGQTPAHSLKSEVWYPIERYLWYKSYVSFEFEIFQVLQFYLIILWHTHTHNKYYIWQEREILWNIAPGPPHNAVYNPGSYEIKINNAKNEDSYGFGMQQEWWEDLKVMGYKKDMWPANLTKVAH